MKHYLTFSLAILLILPLSSFAQKSDESDFFIQQAHTRPVRALAVSKNRIYTGGDDMRIKTWDLWTGEVIEESKLLYPQPITHLDFYGSRKAINLQTGLLYGGIIFPTYGPTKWSKTGSESFLTRGVRQERLIMGNITRVEKKDSTGRSLGFKLVIDPDTFDTRPGHRIMDYDMGSAKMGIMAVRKKNTESGFIQIVDSDDKPLSYYRFLPQYAHKLAIYPGQKLYASAIGPNVELWNYHTDKKQEAINIQHA